MLPKHCKLYCVYLSIPLLRQKHYIGANLTNARNVLLVYKVALQILLEYSRDGSSNNCYIIGCSWITPTTISDIMRIQRNPKRNINIRVTTVIIKIRFDTIWQRLNGNIVLRSALIMNAGSSMLDYKTAYISQIGLYWYCTSYELRPVIG